MLVSPSKFQFLSKICQILFTFQNLQVVVVCVLFRVYSCYLQSGQSVKTTLCPIRDGTCQHNFLFVCLFFLNNILNLKSVQTIRKVAERVQRVLVHLSPVSASQIYPLTLARRTCPPTKPILVRYYYLSSGLFRFYQCFHSGLFLFQDAIEDKTLHLVITSPQ